MSDSTWDESKLMVYVISDSIGVSGDVIEA